jgi:hypothetical protein
MKMEKRTWNWWKIRWWLPGLVLAVLVGTFLILRSQPMTPDGVARRAEGLLGRRITVRGTVEMIGMSCTEAYCPEDPCCNACWSGLGFKGEWGEIYLTGAGIGCAGGSCEVTCAPFEVGEVYTVTGILRDSMFPFLEIDVEAFESDR